jgi:hypothetical protein
MATDPRKRQKKLAKKAASRKAKRHELVKAKNVGLGEQLAATSQYPVLTPLSARRSGPTASAR